MSLPAAIEEARALARLPRDEALTLMGKSEQDVARGVQYGPRLGLDAVETSTGQVVLDGDRIAVVYIWGDELPDTTPELLLAELGGPGDELPGAAGPHFTVHVYATQGLAFSNDADKLAFVEAFAPTSFEDYRTTLYSPPPQFIA